jgi:NAD(P)-dependent dehydrogenase (short-subunit alcohol dehydrogenase family)
MYTYTDMGASVLETHTQPGRGACPAWPNGPGRIPGCPPGERSQPRPSAATSRSSAGRPDGPARLIAWLVTDEAARITGQVINSEGGFRRWA